MPRDLPTSSAPDAARRDLLDQVVRRRQQGHNWVQMQVRRSRAPKNWDRVRVFPGVYGRCIGECDEKNVFLIDIPIQPLVWFLENQT